MKTLECKSVTVHDTFNLNIGPVGGQLSGRDAEDVKQFKILPPYEASYSQWRIDQIDVVASWAVDDILFHYESKAGKPRTIIGKLGESTAPGSKGTKGGTIHLTADQAILSIRGDIGSEEEVAAGYQPKQTILKVEFAGNFVDQAFGGGSPNPVTTSFEFPNIEWGTSDNGTRLGYEIIGLFGTYGGPGHTQTILSLGAIYQPMFLDNKHLLLDT